MAQVLAALLLLATTATPSGWQELKTAHFTLRTDLDPEPAMRAAVEIERTRAALVAAMWPPVQEVGVEPVDVIVLRDGMEFERYAGRGTNGLYSHLALPPRIVLWGSPDRWEVRVGGPRWLDLPGNRGLSPVVRQELLAHLDVVRAGSSSVLRHELAHHLAAAVYGRQPIWFSEGQAQFLESLRLSEDGRSATIGLINPSAWLLYMRVRSTSVADVLGWQTSGPQPTQGEALGLFGASWQLFQWLFTIRREGLQCYQERLVAAEDPVRSWARCFPDLVPAEMDAVLWDFARRGKPATVAIAVPPTGLRVDVRPLGAADVHLVRAQVALTAATATQRPELAAEARIEVDRALESDPANVGALRLKAPLVAAAERLAYGRRAVAAHPEDGWGWLLLADALWDSAGPSDERDRAYRRAVELLPDSPLVLGRGARNLLSLGQRSEALAWADHGVRLAPWNGEVLVVHALALGASGRCREARAEAERARKALPAGAAALTETLDLGLGRACPAGALPDAGLGGGSN
jgi:tetratricopeptide (TPR) repeat protein